MKVMTMLIIMFWSPALWAMDIPDANTPAAKMFQERCSVCHALPHPSRLDWAHWRHMLSTMKQRMNERGMTMKQDEWRQIAAYLKLHAR